MGVEADDDTLAERDTDELAERLDCDDVTFVDALNDRIGTLIESAPDLRVDYVVGDASDAFVSSGGHLHFDLVHDGSSIHCVVFEFRLDGVDTDLEDGLQVAVKGDLSYHEDEGQVSILVEDVVDLGEGRYERTYRENRAALEADGLLAEGAKQQLPPLPKRLGIATSAESDAREDAVTSIHGRYPDVDIVIRNASMQGSTAMESMMAAISDLDDDALIDVIVLTRGGGADKHLRVFNETPLCRVIADTDTPIVVGVGHENDRTLADEVADRRVMTPTHAGEIVPERAELEQAALSTEEQLDAAYHRSVTRTVDTLERSLSDTFDDHVRGTLETLQSDLDRTHETGVSERLLTLEKHLDHALEDFKQRSAFEAERTRVAEQHAQSRRRRQAVIVVLLLLVALLIVYIVT